MTISLKTYIHFIVIFIGISSLFCATAYQKNTPANSDGSGDLIYLDRHEVYCNDGEVIQDFRVFRPAGGQIQFIYRCLSTGLGKDFEYTSYTSWTDSADDIFGKSVGTHRMGNIPIQCANDFGLRGFRLETNCPDSICDVRFRFTCTPIKAMTCTTTENTRTDCSDGYNYHLDRVPITQTASNILTGWRLDTEFYWRFNMRQGRRFKFIYSNCNIRDIEKERLTYLSDKTKPTRILGLKFLNEESNQ